MPPKIDPAVLAMKAIMESPENTSAILSKLSVSVLAKTLSQYADPGRTLFAYTLDNQQDITPFLTAVDTRLRPSIATEILSQKIVSSRLTDEGLCPDVYHGLTPLMIAIRIERNRLLDTQSEAVTSPIAFGRTIDTFAINRLLASIKKLSFERNRFDVLSQVNQYNENALMQLLDLQPEQTALVLPNFLDLLQSLSKEHQAILMATICQKSRENHAAYIGNEDDRAGTSLLSIATENQDLKNITLLLSIIQKLSKQQQISLLSHIAPKDGNNEIMVALKRANPEIIDLFLEMLESKKFPPEARKSLLLHTNARGENALMMAIQNGMTAQVKKILALVGNEIADVLTQTTVAIGYREYDTELDKGVQDVYFKEEHNWNALMLAFENDNQEIQNMVLSAMEKLPKQWEKMLSAVNPQGINGVTLILRNGIPSQIERIFSMVSALTPKQQARIFGKTDIISAAFEANRPDLVGPILHSVHYWPTAALSRFLSIKDIPKTVMDVKKHTSSTQALLETINIPESKEELTLYGVQVEMALWLESLEYEMAFYAKKTNAIQPYSCYQASRTLYEALLESYKHYVINPKTGAQTLHAEWTEALTDAAKSSLAQDTHWTEFLKVVLLKAHELLVRIGICRRALEPVVGKSQLGLFGRLTRLRSMEKLDGLHDLAVKLDEGRPVISLK